MTIHQLYYTSCEHGRDGIYGFQVNAATPGIPADAERLAIRASSYEPPSALLAGSAEPDPARFPVSLGYAQVGASATLFESRYVGRDFTGRLGNYFAHALTFDDVDAELGSLLPIDLWRSQIWTSSPVEDPRLPLLPTLGQQGGTGVDLIDTANFLADPGRRRQLGGLLTAVQRVLAQGSGRVILVAGGDQEAALWVSAVTRSLPRRLALGTTFTTYSSRPDDVDVLLACTTADARFSSYGNAVVLDLLEAGPAEQETSAAAEMLAGAWDAGVSGTPQITRVVALSERAQPALTAVDLDDFAVMVQLLNGRRTSGSVVDQLIAGMGFALTRFPGVIDPHGWDDAWSRLEQWLPLAGSDLRQVTPLLQAAQRAGTPVPEPVLVQYATVMVAAGFEGRVLAEELWLPALPDDRLAELAGLVLPLTFKYPQQVQVLTGLGEPLLQHLVAALSGARWDDDRLVTSLPVEVARLLLGRTPPGSRAHQVVTLVLARHGDLDRVDTLLRMLAAGRGARGDEAAQVAILERAGQVLWAQPPELAEALRLASAVRPGLLVQTSWPAEFVVRLLDDARAARLTDESGELAAVLLREPFAGQLNHAARDRLFGIRAGQQFRSAGPGTEPGSGPRPSEELLEETLKLLVLLSDPPLERWITESVAEWVLRVPDALRHYELLNQSLKTNAGAFLPVYARLALTLGPDLSTEQLARLAAGWSALRAETYRRELLNRTLPGILGKRRREADRIAKIYSHPPKDLVALARRRGDGAGRTVWSEWWQIWRRDHEKPTLATRLARVTRRKG